MQDYYALLDLPAEFTPEELRSAYKAAMRRYHPDVAGDSPEANRRAAEVNEAYRTFSNHARRWDYDNVHPEFRRGAEKRHAQAAYHRGWDTAGAGRFGREERDGHGDGGGRRDSRPWAEPSARKTASRDSTGPDRDAESRISHKKNASAPDPFQPSHPGPPQGNGVDVDTTDPKASPGMGCDIFTLVHIVNIVLLGTLLFHLGDGDLVPKLFGILWGYGSSILAHKLSKASAQNDEEGWRFTSVFLALSLAIVSSGILAISFVVGMLGSP